MFILLETNLYLHFELSNSRTELLERLKLKIFMKFHHFQNVHFFLTLFKIYHLNSKRRKQTSLHTKKFYPLCITHTETFFSFAHFHS